MAFSFELGLVISSELYGAISAGPEQRIRQLENALTANGISIPEDD